MRIALVVFLATLAFAPVTAGAPTFEDRVAYQRRIEEVYWRHRIWPRENPTPKPALSSVMTDAAIQAKVEDTLRKSSALETFWGHPITSGELQAELDRMVRDTRDPEMLVELFHALGDDPHVIAETLARQSLADRLIRNWYASDTRFHGEVQRRAEAARAACRTVGDARSAGGDYRESSYAPTEWEERRATLARRFPGGTARPGSLSDLEETADGFGFVALLEDEGDRIKVASVTWAKTPFEDWWSRQRNAQTLEVEAPSGPYTLATPRGGTCTGDTWRTVYTGTPDRRGFHTAVWTGSEMIVWGGLDGNLVYRSGGRYQPSTDTWVATTLNGAPDPRELHTAVWTGSEMIVWGGRPSTSADPPLNTGGRYNPATDTWTATSVALGVPTARELHTAVWTGSEMIVWGGLDGNLVYQAGGRYQPSTNTWVATTLNGAPNARYNHTAVWTGTEMIVWGGRPSTNGADPSLNTGGRYNPGTDTWSATSIAPEVPSARDRHTAVWTGSEMIVWGGSAVPSSTVGLNTGGRYTPGANSWTATSTAVGVPTARVYHTAVWTGTRMLAWGGVHNGTLFNSGGEYNPATNQWTATSTGANVPAARYSHSGVWTGSEMIVWGGYPLSITALETGGRYNPATAAWLPTSTMSAPTERFSHVSVWTGSEMIIWGGAQVGSNVGARYDPATDSWTATVGFLEPREQAAAVWTGVEMIVWGGIFATSGAGARYHPASDTATPTTTVNAPASRYYHSAVWTGTQMIVWGGLDPSNPLSSGGRYTPSSNTWAATSTTGAPAARFGHSAVWTGSQMIVWGGGDLGAGSSGFNTGGRYDPVGNTWSATSTTAGVASPRFFHSAVWAGNEMIVWGGGGPTAGSTGARYSPGSNTWTATSTGANVPAPRENAATIWTGTRMVVWGGRDPSSGTALDTGAKYTPASDSWLPTLPGPALPSARYAHTAEWTGSEMIVWGGLPLNQEAGRYCVGCASAADCFDGQLCTADVCNPDGTCSNPLTVGASCDDGLFCNGPGTCGIDGVCEPAGDPCTAECFDCSEALDACVASPDGVPCGDPSTTACTGPDFCNGGGACLPNHSPNGTACLNACSCSDGVCTGPSLFDLTAGAPGTFNGGQSFSETRGVDVTLLFPDETGNQIVEALTLGGLSVGVPSASVSARIYNSATQALLASAQTTVLTGANQSVRVPIAATLVAGGSYRLAFFINVGAGASAVLFDPSPPSVGGFPYSEPTATFRINQAYSTATDTFPTGQSNFVPRITVESYLPEINNGRDDQCAGQPGFGQIDELSGSTRFSDPLDKNTLSWPAQTGALSYDVARANVRSFTQGCTLFGVAANSFTDATVPAASQALFYLVRSSTPNIGSWGTASSGAESNVPCAP